MKENWLFRMLAKEQCIDKYIPVLLTPPPKYCLMNSLPDLLNGKKLYNIPEEFKELKTKLRIKKEKRTVALAQPEKNTTTSYAIRPIRPKFV